MKLFGAASAQTSNPGATIGRYHIKENPAATLSDVACNMTGSNETVGIDLHQLAQRPTGPLTSRPDRGPSPRRGWWAPVAQPIKRRWGLTAQDTRFACRHYSPPQNPNPIREGGCSGGKRHHAITDAPDPRRSSTGDVAIVLDCRGQHRHHVVSARRCPSADPHRRTRGGSWRKKVTFRSTPSRSLSYQKHLEYTLATFV